jgi:prepilin-type N-terminal cleavage/methylation domain-containing protein
MIMKMKKLRKGQRGFSLIELVIVIAIVGFVTGGLTMTIMQVFNMDARTRNDMTAVYQVRQAGKLVSQDVLQAQSVSAGGSSGFPLTLTWTDEGGTGDSHTVNYTLSGNRLHRSELVGGNKTVTVVAEHIDPDQTSCACCDQASCHQGICDDNEWLTFTVTATVGEQSETRVYQVKPRPGT